MGNRTMRAASLLAVWGISACTVPVELDSNSPSVAALQTSYFISPTGSDGLNCAGVPGLPYKTWACALSKLLPGDTLVVKPGTYNASNGYPLLQCGSNAQGGGRCLPGSHACGTPTQPIRIVAEIERQSLVAPGLAGINQDFDAFQIAGCRHIELSGLRLEGIDASSQTAGAIVDVRNSDHITLRRLVARHTNRHANYHGISILGAEDVLVEESEVYDFHRHGITASNSQRVTFRRNYVNCNNYRAIDSNYPSSAPFRVGSSCAPYAMDGTRYLTPTETNLGSTGLSFYPARDSIMENNIIENVAEAIDIIEPARAPNSSDNVLLRGNISYQSYNGIGIASRESALSELTILDHVSIFATAAGIASDWKGIDNLWIESTSLLSNTRGIHADDTVAPLQIAGSVHVENTLALSNTFDAFLFNAQKTCSITDSLSFGNSPNGSSSWAGTSCPLANSCAGSSCNPNAGLSLPNQVGTLAGQCMVYVPSQNPLLHNAVTGDRGANVVRRSIDGVLTTSSLWNRTTGRFACGANVYGANPPSRTCQNVHERLHIGVAGGCAIP